MTATDNAQHTIARVARRVGPAVVGLGRGWGLGSGVVIAAGQVLTAAHSVRSEAPGVALADGARVAAELVGVDAELGLAVLGADTGAIEPVEWGPAEDPAIGDPVVALANPGGRGLRATPGFVSSAPRSFRGGQGRRVRAAIEHTAPLPRGSSGGPLVDPAGRLLGINSIRVDGGLILAAPAHAALRDRIVRLARGETPPPRRLGVAVAPPRVSRRMRRAVGLPEREGLLVRAVEDASPAQRAGIARGALIVSVAGRPAEGVDALHGALDALPASGGELVLGVVEGTDEREVSVAFGPTGVAA